MKFAAIVLKIIDFIWASLKPVVIIILVFAVIASSLLAYDQYKKFQDRLLGRKLIKKIETVSSCTTIVNAGDKVDLKFTLINKNDQDVNLEKVGIDVSMLGTEEIKFMGLLQTNPKSSKVTDSQNQFETFMFKPSVVLEADNKKIVILKIQAASRKQASASPHTFVAYTGNVMFSFNHEMSIKTPCQIQVRYS